jgi:ABC-type multidrug transport system ATPase subunit
MSNPWLYEIRDLWKTYSNGTKEVEVLRGVNFSVRSGETVAITGPSGVGKSTFLHILGLLDRPATGTVLLDGVDILTLPTLIGLISGTSALGLYFSFSSSFRSFQRWKTSSCRV